MAWTLDLDALEQWAATRNTSIEIARAIFEIADDDDQAALMWEDPAWFGALGRIQARAFELTDADTLHWGVETCIRRGVPIA